ncbi:MAG: cupin domain-containing protein [Bacteroidota bacterium]
MKRIDELIQSLNLQPHPEGGYFKETYRSDGIIEANSLSNNYSGKRNYSTSIYFLLTSDSFSAFHKIHQDEIWHFYEGSPIELHTISESGAHTRHLIGSDISNGEVYQLTIPGNHWFASKVLDPNSYSLVGCTVAPGFDFDDFTLVKRNDLVASFPLHQKLIEEFTH